MQPLFKKIDCLRLYVPDLEKGIDFYHKHLGLPIEWRTETSVGFISVGLLKHEPIITIIGSSVAIVTTLTFLVITYLLLDKLSLELWFLNTL